MTVCGARGRRGPDAVQPVDTEPGPAPEPVPAPSKPGPEGTATTPRWETQTLDPASAVWPVLANLHAVI